MTKVNGPSTCYKNGCYWYSLHRCKTLR